MRQLGGCLLAFLAFFAFLAVWLVLGVLGELALTILGAGDYYPILSKLWTFVSFVLACVIVAIAGRTRIQSPATPPPPLTYPTALPSGRPGCIYCGNRPRPGAAFCNQCGMRL